jgi:hypothetical protein
MYRRLGRDGIQTSAVARGEYVDASGSLHIRMPYRAQLSQRILCQLELRCPLLPILPLLRLLRHIKNKQRHGRPIILFHTTPNIPNHLIVKGRGVCRSEGETVAYLEGESDAC